MLFDIQNVHGQEHTYLHFLESGTLLVEKLQIDQNGKYSSDQKQAYLDIQRHAAEWLENVGHFFKVRFLCDEHQKVDLMSKCMDLTLFCNRVLPGATSLHAFMDGEVKAHYQILWEWARDAGINVEAWETSWQALRTLAERLHAYVTNWYTGEDESVSTIHPWHDKHGMVNVSGVVIQREVMTNKKFWYGVGPFLHMYQMCVLKTSNEAVIEGMGSMVSKHATGSRGLEFEEYAFESIVHWNLPAQGRCSNFLRDSLEMHGSMTQTVRSKARFLSDDKRQRSLTSFVSSVVDKHLTSESKLSFIE